MTSCVGLLVLHRNGEVIVAAILEHEALDAVELSFLHSDPGRLVLVGVFLAGRDQVVPPARGPVADHDFVARGLHRRRLVKLVGAVKPYLAGIIAGHVEAVVTSGRSLEPTIGNGACSRIIFIRVLESSLQLGLDNRYEAISSHVPVWVGILVIRVKNPLLQTR